MNSTNCVDFFNKVPGFFATEPTLGHVHIESVYWVGRVIYYPKTGKLDIKSVTSNDNVVTALQTLSTAATPMPALTILKTVFQADHIATMLVSAFKCPPGM